MKKTKTVLLAMFAAFLLLLSGCGQKDAKPAEKAAVGVPDGTVKLDVLDYLSSTNKSFGQYNNYYFTVDHNYDEASKIDTATIHLTLEYTYLTKTTTAVAMYSYEKANERWQMERISDWSAYKYVYNAERLVGKYSFTTTSGFKVNVTAVSAEDDNVTLSCDIDGYVKANSSFSEKNIPLSLKGEGTFEASNGYCHIPIELPDHFYAGYSGPYNDKNVTISLSISGEEGFNHATFDDILYFPDRE